MYSLLAHDLNPGETATRAKPNFHGYIVLGSTRIRDRKTRSAVVKALYDSVGNGEKMACFDPHHGIRAVKGGRTVDFVVCFDCTQFEVYDRGNVSGGTLSTAPRLLFDRILTDARVPVDGTQQGR